MGVCSQTHADVRRCSDDADGRTDDGRADDGRADDGHADGRADGSSPVRWCRNWKLGTCDDAADDADDPGADSANAHDHAGGQCTSAGNPGPGPGPDANGCSDDGCPDDGCPDDGCSDDGS